MQQMAPPPNHFHQLVAHAGSPNGTHSADQPDDDQGRTGLSTPLCVLIAAVASVPLLGFSAVLRRRRSRT